MSPPGGRVALVGAGPGDPELLTLKAARRIAEADDLIVDALVPAAVYQSSRARVIYVGKRAGRPSISQGEIETLLVQLARAGRRVVRLKGGDPGVFGRAAEEMRALEAAGVDYEVVPGVSAVLAAPATVGVSLTDRDEAEQLLILTGHRRRDHPKPLPTLPPYEPRRTVVLLMAMRHLEALLEQALAAGYPEELPAVAVSHASLSTQRHVTGSLSSLAAAVREAGLETPATVILGSVAARALGRVERLAAGAAAHEPSVLSGSFVGQVTRSFRGCQGASTKADRTSFEEEPRRQGAKGAVSCPTS